MSSPRPSWRPLLAATGGLFLIILAFLAGQLKAGGDPAIGPGTAATQQEQQTAAASRPAAARTRPTTTTTTTTSDDDDDDGFFPDGFIPGGSQPAPPVPGSESQSSADAPATHQS